MVETGRKRYMYRQKGADHIPGTAQMEHFSTPEAEYEAYGCSIRA
jgi:hypothetical protein